ncbi:hypothetical protein LUX02_20070 [Streptomyces somaliensis]|nr:hypothetical protein [Streptomyces somaliensis]
MAKIDSRGARTRWGRTPCGNRSSRACPPVAATKCSVQRAQSSNGRSHADVACRATNPWTSRLSARASSARYAGGSARPSHRSTAGSTRTRSLLLTAIAAGAAM